MMASPSSSSSSQPVVAGTGGGTSSSSSSSFFKLRDYAAFGIFLLTILHNLASYWKETSSSTTSSKQLSLLEHHQHQQYSTFSIREQQQQQYDASSRIAAATSATVSPTRISQNYTTTAAAAAFYNDEETTTTIRQWGCHLRQTPLIYVHIGKAGGGMVRARFAASALNFGANQNWREAGQAYYPVRVDNDSSNDTVGDGELLHQHHDDDSNNSSSDDTVSFMCKKAYFCNSGFPNFRAHGKRSFEGTLFCHATTPLGQAVACPVPLSSRHYNKDNNNNISTATTSTRTKKKALGGSCRMACRADSDACRIVYVGHNLLGSEMHWLPQRFLSNWWTNVYLKSHHPPALDSSSSAAENLDNNKANGEPKEHRNDNKTNTNDDDDQIQYYLQTLAPGDASWCPHVTQSRPVGGADEYLDSYAQCAVTLAHVVDQEAFRTVQARQRRHYPVHHYHDHHHPAMTTNTTTASSSSSSRSTARLQLLPQHPQDYMDWSHVYASMPVLRTTIIRNPFSWLVSKFFWHRFGGRDVAAVDVDEDDESVLKCDDVEMATRPVHPFRIDDKEAQQDGWANRYALNYITFLCGEDCAARYHQGIGNLHQMEKQAANNLRHSFAVVGLLEETDTFYDMVTKRVQYVNMSLNAFVQGAIHSSGKGPEQLRCKEKFSDASFQALLKEKSPIIAALDRLYQVGVQVNRFQLEELQSCPATPTHA